MKKPTGRRNQAKEQEFGVSQLTVALVQCNSTLDREANRQQIARFVAEAAGQGAQLVVLPELCWWLGPLDQVVALAEPVPGPTSSWAAELAQKHRLWLVAGSLAETSPGEKRAWNTSLVFSPQGELVSRYRKRYLFQVDLPGQVSVDEGRYFLPGKEVASCATPWGELGLAICFDLRFSEHFLHLARRGVPLVAVPSAFTYKTGQAHWKLLVRARAVENQAFVLAANQCGEHAPGMTTWGHSLIVDPWGQVVAGLEDSPGVAVATVDREQVEQVRRQLPVVSILRREASGR